MLRSLIAVFLLIAGMMVGSAAEQADTTESIALSLAFSTDRGATWRSDPPVIREPALVQVRLRWRCTGQIDDRDMLYPDLAHAGGDFASANRGQPSWDAGRRWIQCPDPAWIFPHQDEVVLGLDPRARPAGVVGWGNLWDEGTKEFVNAPLPACAALSNGTYAFAAEVAYRSKRSKLMVGASVPFVLTIGGVAPAAAAKPDTARLPDLRTVGPRDQTPAAITLPAEALLPVLAEPIDREPGFARGGVAAWTVAANQAGVWYPTLQVTISDNISDQLHLYTPWLFLDGRGIRFTTAGVPWVIDGLGAVVELRATEPVTLVAGDELRLAQEAIGQHWIGQLGLLRTRPAAGINEVWPFTPEDATARWLPRATLELGADPAHPGMARLEVVGAAGPATAATVRWRILDYFQVEVAAGSEAVSLATGVHWTKDVPFTWGASDRYRVVLAVDEPGAKPVEAVAEVLAPARWNAYRSAQWLTSGWSFIGRGDSDKDMATPPSVSEAGLPVTLPTTWHTKGGHNRCGWLRTTIDSARLPPGRRELRFLRLPGASTVWIDGVQVAAHDGHAAFSVDLTAALAGSGAHELLIGMVQGDVKSWSADSVRYAGEAVLSVRPLTAIATVQVQPSVRQHTLTLAVATTTAPAGAQVQAIVRHRGTPVLTLPAVRVAANGRATLSARWADPVLWDLGHPELLRIDVELLTADGTVLDQAPVRSGFKELWTEGTALILNGTPVKFRATAMDGLGADDHSLSRASMRDHVRMALAHGSQMRRHCSYWDTSLDACDEEGLLTCTYVAWTPAHDQPSLDDEAQWRRISRIGAENVTALAHHPAVAIWYLANEFAETASDPALAITRLQTLGAVIRAADPTRLVEAGCDLDLRGWNNLTSTHYPVDVGAFQAPATYLPGGALWRPEGQPFTSGMAVPGGQFTSVANVQHASPITWGRKPILVGETGWNMFYGPPGGFAALIGDAAYHGSVALDLAHHQANNWFIAGDRDAGASLVTSWMQPYWGSCFQALPAVDAFPWTRHACWYAGEEVTWDVNLHHDLRTTSSARFAWTLTADGKALAGASQDLTLAPAELRRTQIRFSVPPVKATTPAVLTLGLVTADGTGTPRSFPVVLQPRTRLRFPAADAVALFDPSGTTATAASILGWKPTRLTTLDAAHLKSLRLLVIGEGAGADATLVAAGDAVQRFVADGGAVLVLRQREIASEWVGTHLSVTAKRTSQVFIRAPNHPVLAGLCDADLQFWFPDHLVSSGDLVKPTAGDFTVLSDAALGGAGQDYVQLLDWRVGAGRYVFCQLALSNRLGRQPVADLLLSRLTLWAASDRHGHRPAVVAAQPGSAVQRALRSAGLVIATTDDPVAPLIIDASRAPEPAQLVMWKSRLTAGGRVLVHGVDAGNARWVSDLIGHPVQVTSNKMADWRGRAVRTASHPLSDGIANADLFWRKNSQWENLCTTFCVDDFVLDSLYDVALQVEGGQALTYPAILVAVPVGTGVALLDTIRWESDETLVAPQAHRLAATLCANLGARLESRRTRTWVTDLDMQMLDLAPYANRGLADDKADDGIGGFSDQGPECDLRAWSTGRQMRRGIPFTVAPEHSAIVLASRFRPGTQPESVTIPIGRTVRALNFLQTSAWTGNLHHASYLVRYADGSQIEIPLVGGINYFDWQGSYGDEVSPEETDTYTRYAGSVPVIACGKAGAFVMQWLNPQPGKEVREVVFVSKHQGVPILLGLTLGLDPAPVDTTPGDRPAAEHLRLAAKSAVPDTAIPMLVQALRTDPSDDAARLDLAAAQLAAHQDEAAERTLRAAVRARSGLLQGYADLAHLLESQGRWDEAVDVWKRSLIANPNQPEVYHARDRAQGQVDAQP